MEKEAKSRLSDFRDLLGQNPQEARKAEIFARVVDRS
jgi:hypothetical protein